MEIRGSKGFGIRAIEALNNLPALLAAKGLKVIPRTYDLLPTGPEIIDMTRGECPDQLVWVSI
jgi:hypothetical protein